MFLKQSTAVTVKIGPFVDQGDGFTPETSLTISQADIRLTKNGGDFAQTNNAAGATHDESGYYDIPLDTTDTNTLGTLRVAVSESGALPVWQDFMVVPANVWDSLFGADRLQVHAAEISNDLITSDALAASAVSEIQSGLATSSALATAQSDLDTITGSDGVTLATAQANYAPAKAGDEMDLVDAPNATAIAAIQSGLATPTNITAGTITTVTNLTNAPTNGDLTATMKASVNAEVDAAIETYHLDHLLAATYDPSSKPGAADALLNELVENDGGVSRYTANALEQAPTGGSAPTAVEIRQEMDANSTQFAAIVADTNELQTDWANGGRLDNILDARASQASVDTIDDFLDTEVAAILEDTGTTLPAQISALNNLSAAQVNAEVDTALADINLDHLVKNAVDTDFPTTVHLNSVIGHIADNGTSASFDRTTDSLEALQAEHDATQSAVNAVDDFVDTEVAAIKAQTDKLTFDGSNRVIADAQAISASTTAADNVEANVGNLDATVSSRASQTSVNTIDDFLDTEVAAILADTNELQTDWSNGGRLDLILDSAAAGATAAEIADAVLEELLADHDHVSGGLAEAVLLVRKLLQNRVAHSGTTITVYDDDSTTPLLTRIPKDKNGTAINSSSYDANIPAEVTRAA